MKISNKNNNNNNTGFTLIELVVVIAGLASLSAFAIPSILNNVRLNKIEEVKALMNGYASDCLGKFRTTSDPVEFIENATPDELDNIKLSTLGYQIDDNKNKCSHVAIKPIKENEENLYAFDFRISIEGRVLKTGIPSNNPRFLNSCERWAGTNCGLSEEQKAEFARLDELARAKSVCLSNYSTWLSDGNSGEFVSWNTNDETCTRSVFAFEGIPVNSAEAVEQALQNKYGQACAKWRTDQKDENITSSDPMTLDPECGGVNYWFHSGIEFTSQVAWTEHDNTQKKQACEKDRDDALDQGTKGRYTYGPTPGPSPCGKVVWLCNGEEHESLSGYENSSCSVQPVDENTETQTQAQTNNPFDTPPENPPNNDQPTCNLNPGVVRLCRNPAFKSQPFCQCE